MKKIPFYLDRRQILILRGLRRTGKTTLLYQIIHYLLKEKKVSPNLLTSEKKRKKYYLAYPAFAFALALTGEWSKEFKGKLVENLFVFLFKARFFCQSSTKEKVDIILPKESSFLPIEIKYRGRIQRKDLAGLKSFINRHNSKRGYLVSYDFEAEYA